MKLLGGIRDTDHTTELEGDGATYEAAKAALERAAGDRPLLYIRVGE